VRHRGGDAASKRLDEGEACGNAVTMTGGEGLTLHVILSSRAAAYPRTGLRQGNRDTSQKPIKKRNRG
jgi:hypothetical protein